jgi:4'-phosphopantetheinyl transferase
MSRPDILWSTPPSRWPLNGNEIHVWAATSEVSSREISAFEKTLSLDEVERAGQFKLERDRNRFVACRGCLRAILAAYLETGPQEVNFEYGPRGKPWLANKPETSRLHFNVAHSENLFLTAISRICPLGVDVERIRFIENTDDLVKLLLCTTEELEWNTVAETQKLSTFFRIWTCKEACLKATGDGIAESLREIAVSFLPGEPARLIKPPAMPIPNEDWTLSELNPAGEFAAAIAAPTRGFDLSCWRWSN